MEELVSVIIPAYNVERYIKQCVYSVINQTYENLEIVIVNDGSIDNTAEECRKLQIFDKRITMIEQENKGLSMARNIGYDHSHGKWICFIDSDDWIEPNYVEVLMGLATKYNADISICKSRNVNDQGHSIISDKDTYQEFVYDEDEAISSLCRKAYNIRFEVWNKLWSRKLIDPIRFVRGQVSEDVHFDRIAFMRAKTIVYTDITLHNYRFHRPGNTNSTFKNARFCVFDEFDAWIKELENRRKESSIRQIGYIACNISARMYCEARRTKQGKNTTDLLVNIFKKYYSYVRGTKQNRVLLVLFYLSPFFYNIVFMIYKSIRDILWYIIGKTVLYQ